SMDGSSLVCHVTYTEDGKSWSKPEPVYRPGYVLWKPLAHQGRYWATAHRKDDSDGGKHREVHLITSKDGIAWEKVSTIRAGSWESETTLLMQGDRAVAFLRQKYGSPQAQVLESTAPYSRWQARPTAPLAHFAGHSVHTFKGVTYLLTRTFDARRQP